MADRAATRLAIDLGFVGLLIACAITVYAQTRAPDIPDGVCRADSRGPRYDAMLADGRITVAAVFGELQGGPTDHNLWSYRAFASALRDRGFAEDGDRFTLGNVTIDLALVPDDPAQTSAALAGALARHDVVYYNGHSHDGAIDISPPHDYRLIVLDSCWSTQEYAQRLVGPERDVLTNSDRSVTGSVESFVALLDAIRAHEHWPLDEMNALAEARAHKRAPVSRFKDPERYRVDGPCNASASRRD
ncbi:MAG TPA: hypothetical protein VFV99_04185 [Kofleriaceae bacterium]|nr:hypothetical protein [Kofleriaceae bacterium]